MFMGQTVLPRVLAVTGLMVCGADDSLIARAMSAAGAGAPTIVGLSDRTEQGSELIGPLLFTIGDDTTPAGDLVVTASSSNQGFVPDANISIGGSGATRALGLRTTRNTTGRRGERRSRCPCPTGPRRPAPRSR